MTDTQTVIPDQQPLRVLNGLRKAMRALGGGLELLVALPTVALILAGLFAFVERMSAENFVTWLGLQLELLSTPISVLLTALVAVAFLLTAGIVILVIFASAISTRWQAENPAIDVFEATDIVAQRAASTKPGA